MGSRKAGFCVVSAALVVKQAIPGGYHPGRLQVPRFFSRQCTSAGSALEGRGWPLAPPAHGGDSNSPQWRTFSSTTSPNCFCATLEKLPFLPKGSCCGQEHTSARFACEDIPVLGAQFRERRHGAHVTVRTTVSEASNDAPHVTLPGRD